MEYKPFGQPHEVLVTSVIPMDRPLKVATDLAGRMIGPVTVITDDKMVGAASLKVESGDDPHYSYANYGPVNPPEYDSNEYRYVALWVKLGSGAEYVQFDVRDVSEGRFETIRADIGDDPDIWSSENGRFYVGQELDQDKWYLILLDLKQTNNGGVLGQVSQFQWYTNENSTWQWDGIKSATVSQNLKQYRFTGKEPDDNGLLYFGARYYDPEVGRFLTLDPARQGLKQTLTLAIRREIEHLGEEL
jgi:RHS repeat-associated protein